MGIEEEVLFKLEDHEKKIGSHDQRLCSHDDKISELQIKDIGFEGRFNNVDNQIGDIKSTLIRMENTSLQNLQSSNLLINTISQIATNTSNGNTAIAKAEHKNNTEITKVKVNKGTEIAVKVITVIGAVVAGYFTAVFK